MHIGKYELNENESGWCLEEAEAVLGKALGHFTSSLNHKFAKEDLAEFLSYLWTKRPEQTKVDFDEDEDEKEED